MTSEQFAPRLARSRTAVLARTIGGRKQMRGDVRPCPPEHLRLVGGGKLSPGLTAICGRWITGVQGRGRSRSGDIVAPSKAL